jgi:hypothetical protein
MSFGTEFDNPRLVRVGEREREREWGRNLGGEVDSLLR